MFDEDANDLVFFNEEEWQPAVLLPETSMCEFHRAFFETCSSEVKEARGRSVGKKILVRPAHAVGHPTIAHEKIQSKGCKPLILKTEEGLAGCFSCEVSMD